MSTELLQVDAFAAEPFSGNPAAVCLLDAPVSAGWMQQVAQEMNLSETAFVGRRADGDLDLRWFTPTVEVDLCGHATLASAHALWEVGWLDKTSQARFHTRSGLLTASLTDHEVELDFPTQPETPAPAPPGLIDALGLTPRYVGKNQTDYLIEVGSEEEVRGLQPDFRKLADVPMRGVMVTSEAAQPGASSRDVASESAPYDFVSRFFAPASGIDEDPVTGSAHCCLGPHWSRKLGREALTGFQASSRGGLVRLVVEDDRVRLFGRAVTVFRAGLLC